MDSAHFAHFPGLQQPLCEANDDVGIRRDAVTVEGWLRESSLTQPKLAFTRQQALAKEPSHERRAIAERFPKVAALGREHTFNVRGIVQQTNGSVAEPEWHEIAIVAGALFQEAKGIAAKLP
jgi:hypothetical protein